MALPSVSGDNDPIVPVAPQVAYTKTHLFDAVLILIIVVFGIVDLALALRRRWFSRPSGTVAAGSASGD